MAEAMVPLLVTLGRQGARVPGSKGMRTLCRRVLGGGGGDKSLGDWMSRL